MLVEAFLSTMQVVVAVVLRSELVVIAIDAELSCSNSVGVTTSDAPKVGMPS